MVRISPDRPSKPAEAIKPPKNLAAPTIIAAPPPEIVVQTTTPPIVASAATHYGPCCTSSRGRAARWRWSGGDVRDNFLPRLLAQLKRFRQYPRAARQAHIQGVVMLHFVMDAQGKVLRFEIAKSSGRPVLDNEALALIEPAPSPCRPCRPIFRARTLDAVVPIEFSLNG